MLAPSPGVENQALDDTLLSLSFRPRCTAEVWNADDVDGRRGEDCTTRRELARMDVRKDMMMMTRVGVRDLVAGLVIARGDEVCKNIP